jgi:PHD/YefM family antitoxin component YafN of YafNO toxin-antitoxin module
MSVSYVVDENGKRVSVILPVEEHERMVEALEDLEDARAADEVRAAVARGEDEFIPYEQARKEIAEKRAAKR